MTRVLTAIVCLAAFWLDGATLLVPSQYSTIQLAHNSASAGDTIRVSDGTYGRVNLTNSGGVGNWITFIGNSTGTGVVTLGFEVYSASNVRLIGMEIRHTNTTYLAGIHFNGTVSNFMVIDNYIHDTYGEGIRAYPATVSFLTVRGNQFYYIGHPGTLSDADTAIAGLPIVPHHWLVEYNHIQRTMDFVVVYGQTNIVRNNWLHDYSYSYYNVNGHSDMFQPGSDSQDVRSRHHVYERNFTGDSVTDNSHFGLWQDTVTSGDTNHLIRGNVGYALGASGVGMIGTHRMSVLQNTLHTIGAAGPGAALYGAQQRYATNGTLANNVVALADSDGGGPIQINSTLAPTLVRSNWGYSAESSSSFVGTTDPLFSDTNALDFRLQSGSPLRGQGYSVIAITSSTGSGTSFTVDQPQMLLDGFSMTEGDVVVIGSTTTRITSADWSTSTVTVADSVSWTQNDPIYWGQRGDQKDIGAYPYGATFLTAATISHSGNDYTVSTTGDARGVWFYVDGVPTTWDYDAPYTQTIASGTVTAKAYALWAQTNPVVLATDAVDYAFTRGTTRARMLRPRR